MRATIPLVVEYLHHEYPAVFSESSRKLRARVPSITRMEPKQTEEGRLLLDLRHGALEGPLLARWASNGAIKMLVYLTLLYDPDPASPAVGRRA